MFLTYEDYENELARQQWFADRENYLDEQADIDYYERRYGYDDDFD